MVRQRPRALQWLPPGLLLALVAAGCGASLDPDPGRLVPGDPAAGRVAIEEYGCGACHVVPGVTGAVGLVGPPLERFSERRVIAGVLPNTPENLARWIENPQAVQPGNAMPNLGVTPQEAADIVAYLHTLR
jgi:cytochrome c